MSTGNRTAVVDGMKHLLAAFRPIGLKEMEDVHLMSRFDMKYVFKLSLLPKLLEQLQHHYRALVIDDLPLFIYENLYFDSPELKSYHDHHNGKAVRYKIRFRKYTDSGKCYLEVKLKTNKGLTEKARLDSEDIHRELSQPQMNFLQESLGNKLTNLQPQISNDFSRITLVNEPQRERLTLDFLIHFKNGSSEKWMDELVIAEVKQEHPSNSSVFKRLMQAERIFPTSISKYCLGTLLTHPGIKYNRFKSKLIILNKICDGVA